MASKLNNTKAVCKRSYVHPAIVELFVDGERSELWAAGQSRDGRWLLKEERKPPAVLREARSARDGIVNPSLRALTAAA